MEEQKIIRKAPLDMQEMLDSVLYYNSSCRNKKLLRKILFSMIIIDRKFFVDANPYFDGALPVGRGQTISQPSTVARMLLLAELGIGDDVLEIGAGSGWSAALISLLVYPGSIKSVERIASLVKKAQGNLAKLKDFLKQKYPQDIIKLGNINFLIEDIFSKGRSWKKKYDKILITAGIKDKKTERKVEELAKRLLKKNGVLICPYVSGPLVIYKKKDKLEREETREHYLFVPLLEGVEE